MKKLVSMLLALMMILGLATTAFAAQEGTLTGGSITINDAISGQTYSAYQILYLESYDATAGAYAYKANSTWEDWLKTQTTYVTIDDQGYVTWVEGASAAEFAKLAQGQLPGKTADATATASSATVTLSDLKLGYYLLDTTTGTLCSLDTTNPNVVMEEKNTEPTIDKTVEEDLTGVYGDTNDAEIGQIINFKTVIKAYAGAQNYVLHDKMSAGLSLDQNSIAIEGLTKDTDYTVVFNTTDGCDFEITFTQTYLDKITGTAANPTLITVTYAATVNNDAVIAGSSNSNEASLDYGEDSNTEWDETITYVWSMKVLKYGDNDETKVLKGAEFVLLNSDKSKVATIVNGKLTGWVDIPTASNDGTITWPGNTVLTTDDSGPINIEGVDADTYYLRETKAPAGYNKLANDIEVIVAAGSVTEGTMIYNPVVAKVNNKSGTELPATGGIGTTLLYVIGGVLVLAAVIMLVTKKRMNAAK